MPFGCIEKIYRDKGFGFIRYGDRNAFFHASECTPDFDGLYTDQAVSFELEHHPKGLRARKVITGFVTFATAPTANETNKSDVSAFSISAGPVTITESSPSLSTIFSFDFDAGLNIVDWDFDAQAEVFSSATSAPEELWTYLFSSDAASTGDTSSTMGFITGADNVAINFSIVPARGRPGKTSSLNLHLSSYGQPSLASLPFVVEEHDSDTRIARISVLTA